MTTFSILSIAYSHRSQQLSMLSKDGLGSELVFVVGERTEQIIQFFVMNIVCVRFGIIYFD